MYLFSSTGILDGIYNLLTVKPFITLCANIKFNFTLSDINKLFVKMSLTPIKISLKNKKLTSVQGVVTPEQNAKRVEIQSVTNSLGKLKIKTKKAAAYEKFDKAFTSFESDVNQLNLNQKQNDNIIKSIKCLLENQSDLYKTIIENKFESSKSDLFQDISEANSHVQQKLGQISNAHMRKKHLQENPLYVPPHEKAIGLRWRDKSEPCSQIPNYVIEQTTFQYVKIKETLLSLFKNPSFKKIYFEYNQNQKHTCVDGVYQDYCCSDVYKKNNFHQFKDAVIIQIGTDDFDVCCPLKSKATIHKLTALYMKIKNLPHEYKSKLDCIFLISLCETVNTKQHDTSLNDIYQLVVEELTELQESGLQVDENTNLKVFLFDFVSDNLGMNGALGFIECFIVDGMCRFCEMTKDEWRVACREDERKIRTESDYKQAMEYIESLHDDEAIDFKISKGLKKSTVLQKLENFSILQNVNVDIMHDFLEGVIPHFIENFIRFCSERKIASNTVCQIKIRDFSYGFLNKRNLPSQIKTTSSHLNQNATQLRVIMLHLPFIFQDFRQDLTDIHECLTSLLQALQILFSTKIYEADVHKLEMLIEKHLSSYQIVFGAQLTAKHNFSTHYGRIIRNLGPVLFATMMSYESKHKVLASFGKSQCFKNIALTITERHQMMMCKNQFNNNMFVESKRTIFDKSSNFNRYEHCIRELNFNIDQLYCLKFLNYTHFQYRKGLFFVEEFRVHKILEILVYNDIYTFICEHYEVIGFDSFLNNIQISSKRDNNFEFICFTDLKNKQSYQQTNAFGNAYIIADTLNVHKPQ